MFENVNTDGPTFFLDGQPNETNKIGLFSYPRSGNSFTRKLVESVTGIASGAVYTLNTDTDLQMLGFKGEEIVDDTTWMAKCHHPFFLPGSLSYKMNKTILVVRNPYDVIISFALLCLSLSHSLKPEF